MLPTDSNFSQYINKLGNSYAAVNYIAKQAKKLASDNDNKILYSEAITWLLTGDKPKVLDIILAREQKAHIHTDYIDDLLSLVDNPLICQSVRQSIKASKLCNHLIYFYTHLSDDNDKARVRILTRMVWYNQK